MDPSGNFLFISPEPVSPICVLPHIDLTVTKAPDYIIVFGRDEFNNNLATSEYTIGVICPCGCKKLLEVHVN